MPKEKVTPQTAEKRKPVTNKEFEKIMETMKNSHASIPVEYVLSIMGGVVKSGEKEAPDVKALAAAFKDLSVEDIIAKTVLFTCNSIVISMWDCFGKKFEELASLADKKKAEAEKKTADA